MFQTFLTLFVCNEPEMQRHFSTNDVISLTGITARQLQWWDERGLIRPTRQGHRRIYNWDQLVTAAVIFQLRRRGFALQRLRKVITFLAREFGTSLAATVRASSEYHLLTDGTHLYLRTSPRQVVDLLKNSSQPMFDICLSDEVRRVRGEIRRGRILTQKAPLRKTESQKKRVVSEPVPLTRPARRA
jgi:DNA-binding transcriptional MerR regulator